MTEYELVESIGTYLSNALQATAIYLTIISAYLVAAFMAGQRLTKSQVIIVNVLFITGALIFTYATVGMIMRQYYFAHMLAQIETNTFLAGTMPMAPIIGFLQIGGIAASLKFMWDVRHSKTD